MPAMKTPERCKGTALLAERERRVAPKVQVVLRPLRRAANSKVLLKVNASGQRGSLPRHSEKAPDNRRRSATACQRLRMGDPPHGTCSRTKDRNSRRLAAATAHALSIDRLHPASRGSVAFPLPY